jgi:hypothetical protein
MTTPSLATITLKITVEPKDEPTPEGIEPCFPSPAELAQALGDTVFYATKRDPFLGWRVIGVRPS